MNKIEVQIANLGMGNNASIANALLRVGVKSRLLDLDKGPDCKILFLPGVGHFTSGSNALDERNLRPIIKEHVRSGGALIGICLGMQLLGTSSEEGGGHGLGLLDFKVQRIADLNQVSKPIMGWQTPVLKQENWLGLEGNERYYFTHDYGVLDSEGPSVKMAHRTGYGFVASALGEQNVIGFQFHPERSLTFGQKILHSAVKELSK